MSRSRGGIISFVKKKGRYDLSGYLDGEKLQEGAVIRQKAG